MRGVLSHWLRSHCTPSKIARCAALLIAFLNSCVWLAKSSVAQFPSPELRALSPSFFAPGHEYLLKVASGKSMDETAELRFSHPDIEAQPKPGPARPFDDRPVFLEGEFRVTVPKSIAPGRYDVLSKGRFGISNTRSVLVAKNVVLLDQVAESYAKATPMEPNHIYSHRTSPRKTDFFKLHVTKGQSLRIRLIANSIDSRMLGRLAVSEIDGRVIKYAAGTPDSDACLSYRSSKTQDLIIQVRDLLYRGGPEFSYGLMVSDQEHSEFDWIDAIPTRLAQASTVDSVMIGGKTTPANHQDGSTPLAEKRLPVPGEAHGNFYRTSNSHFYTCQLQKDHPITVNVISQRASQSTDIQITMEQSAAKDSTAIPDPPTLWKPIASADDGPVLSDGVLDLRTNDPKLKFNPPVDGLYRIRVTDRDNGTLQEQNQKYRLSIEPSKPDWRLVAYLPAAHKDVNQTRPKGFNLRRGEAVTIRVFLVRDGINDSVRVNAVNLPVGLSCQPSWIAANQNQTDLTVIAADDAPPCEFELSIQGDREIDEKAPSRRATLAAAAWERDPQLAHATVRTVEKLTGCVVALDQCPVRITASMDTPMKVKKGDQIKVPISIARREGGKKKIVVRARDLPKGFRAGDLTIPADQDAAEWNVEVRPEAVEGTYTFWGQGETTVKVETNPQSLQRARQYRDDLKSKLDDEQFASQRESIQAALASAEADLVATEKRVAPRETTVFIPSSLITLSVVP